MSTRPLPAPMTFGELQSRATISFPEAAALLGVSRPHVYVLANRGELPMVCLGGRRVISAPLLVQRLTTSESPSEDLTQ
jgi:excisionase family DNA binding protein